MLTLAKTVVLGYQVLRVLLVVGFPLSHVTDCHGTQGRCLIISLITSDVRHPWTLSEFPQLEKTQPHTTALPSG